MLLTISFFFLKKKEINNFNTNYNYIKYKR